MKDPVVTGAAKLTLASLPIIRSAASSYTRAALASSANTPRWCSFLPMRISAFHFPTRQSHVTPRKRVSSCDGMPTSSRIMLVRSLNAARKCEAGRSMSQSRGQSLRGLCGTAVTGLSLRCGGGGEGGGEGDGGGDGEGGGEGDGGGVGGRRASRIARLASASLFSASCLRARCSRSRRVKTRFSSSVAPEGTVRTTTRFRFGELPLDVDDAGPLGLLLRTLRTGAPGGGKFKTALVPRCTFAFVSYARAATSSSSNTPRCFVLPLILICDCHFRDCLLHDTPRKLLVTPCARART